MSQIKQWISNTFQAEGQEIVGLDASVDKDVLEKAVHKLLAVNHVFTSGCGTSAIAARKMNHTLNCIGTPCTYLAPSDALHGALGGVGENDAIILVSKGGSTQELVHMLDSCNTMNVFTICVTENDDSYMARHCSLYIKVRVTREPDQYNMLATASTLSVIAVFDAIAIAMMNTRGFDMDSFHLKHPGGAVGERLTGKVLYKDS